MSDCVENRGACNNVLGVNNRGCNRGRGIFGDKNVLLFFFLLLVIIFCNCRLFRESQDTLLFFFLLLVVLFGGGTFFGF